MDVISSISIDDDIDFARRSDFICRTCYYSVAVTQASLRLQRRTRLPQLDVPWFELPTTSRFSQFFWISQQFETMSSADSNPKIIDLIKKKDDGSKPFVSIEFFPPRTETGVKVRSFVRSFFLFGSEYGAIRRFDVHYPFFVFKLSAFRMIIRLFTQKSYFSDCCF